MKNPTYLPHMRNLKQFTAICLPTDRKMQVDRLCIWIRRIIAASPIETLRILTEGDDSENQICHGELFSHLLKLTSDTYSGPSIAFDAIIYHLLRRHSKTLRSLHMKNGLVKMKTLRKLLEACSLLEDLCISVDKSAVVGQVLSKTLSLR